LIDDRCVEAAYNQLNKKENEHVNLFLFRNCKSEAGNLLDRAKKICESWYAPQNLPFVIDINKMFGP